MIKTYIPEHMGRPVVDEVSKTYQTLFDAFHEVNEVCTDHEKAPVEVALDSDDMAVKIVGKLIEGGLVINKIQFLCDCRTSITGKVPAPSYKVAVLNSIKNVLPFSIQGQVGTEGTQSFLILNQMMYDKKLDSGAVSLVQKMNIGDRRISRNDNILGDGAAALLVEQRAEHGYELLNVVIKRNAAFSKNSLSAMINELCEKVGHSADEIKIVICQNVNETFKQEIKQTLPDTAMYERRNNKSVDFGCADVFITLKEAENASWISDNGVILLLSAGKTDHIGAMLLRYRKAD